MMQSVPRFSPLAVRGGAPAQLQNASAVQDHSQAGVSADSAA